MKYNLLSPATSNAKLAKNDTTNYIGAILYLAPYNLSGQNVCPNASEGCAKACLNTAGRGAFSNVQSARLRRTKLFFEDRSEFMRQLTDDLTKLKHKAWKENKKAYCRLNGTSDLTWFNVISEFPEIQFYDYTARLDLVSKLLRKKKTGALMNYDLTFSAKEDNQFEYEQALALGLNVAMVFDKVPSLWSSRAVISGDAHDMRFIDQKCARGYFVGLTAKGKAKQDDSGFVRRVCG